MNIPNSPQPANALPAPRRLRRRKLWWIVGLILLLLISAPVGFYYYLKLTALGELTEVLAETDRLDPGWRLKDIEAKRKNIPPEENASLVVGTVDGLLPRNWGIKQELYEALEKYPPQFRLHDPLVQALSKELQAVGPALKEARKIIGLPQGRYFVTWSPDFISTLLPHNNSSRGAAALLHYDVLLQSQEKHFDEGWLSCQGILNTARSIGDEATFISFLIRVALQAMALQAMERTLGQGQPSPQALAFTQRLLEDEAAQKGLFQALCGERAGMHILFTNLQEGKVSLGALGGAKGASNFKETVGEFFSGPMVARSHAWILKFQNEMIGIAQQPLVEQRQLIKDFRKKMDNLDRLRGAPSLAMLLLPASSTIFEAQFRGQAKLRCAIAALACEQFRQQHQRWPQTLDEVVASKLLAEVPTDPYDGKPLRYRTPLDGVVIYSIGPESKYKGDVLDNNKVLPSGVFRYEFRLWNVDKRGQPAELVPFVENKEPG